LKEQISQVYILGIAYNVSNIVMNETSIFTPTTIYYRM